MPSRIVAVSFATLACALVVGCGPSKPKEGIESINPVTGQAKINLGDGTVATLGVKPPANMPGYAKIYPGATIQSSVSASGTPGSGPAGMLVLLSSDSPDKMVDFYKKAAADAGLTQVTEANMSGTRIFSAQNGDKALSVTTAPQGDKTMAQLTYK